MNFIKRNIWELERSSSLIFLGGIFSAIHIINYFFWINSASYLGKADASPLLCWDFFGNCTEIFFVPPALTSALLTTYLIAACVAFLVFLTRRFVGFAWSLLFITFLLKTIFYVQDASLQLNLHALILIAQFCYLFVPNKLNSIRTLIFATYLLNGIGKMTPEYLSGAAIPSTIPLPLKGLEWVGVFSIVIEILMPFFLLSRQRLRFAYGFGVLFIFHIAQLYLTHSFEPLGMAILLLFFVAEHFEYSRRERESFYRNYEHPEPSKIWWALTATIFFAAQFPPTAHSPLALIKIEPPRTYLDCKQITFVYFKDHIEQTELLADSSLARELACNKSVAFNRVKNICEKNRRNADFKNVASYFLSRRLAETDFSPVFSSDRFCDSTYSLKDARGKM
jgi:hypothetical protein